MIQLLTIVSFTNIDFDKKHEKKTHGDITLVNLQVTFTFTCNQNSDKSNRLLESFQ